jgi:DNA-binding response OmpR family regulator
MTGTNFGIMLSRMVVLRHGPALATLGDGVRAIGSLPEFPDIRPAWRLACDAIRHAAATGRRADIERATCELELAVLQDGLLADDPIDRPTPRIQPDQVLVVDADPRTREIVRAAVYPHGACRLTFAADGTDAVSILEKEPPDLALIDPLICGFPARALAQRALELTVPIVLTTNSQEVARSLRALHWPYLIKPFGREAVLDQIRGQLADTEGNLRTCRRAMERLDANGSALCAGILRAKDLVQRSREARERRTRASLNRELLSLRRLADAYRRLSESGNVSAKNERLAMAVRLEREASTLEWTGDRPAGCKS